MVITFLPFKMSSFVEIAGRILDRRQKGAGGGGVILLKKVAVRGRVEGGSSKENGGWGARHRRIAQEGEGEKWL